jgi:asparagine synthase (glutamine-hydrolysing)
MVSAASEPRASFWGVADLARFGPGRAVFDRVGGEEPGTASVTCDGLRIVVRTGAAVVDVPGGVVLVSGSPALAGSEVPATATDIAAALRGGAGGEAPTFGGRYSIVHIDVEGRCVRLLTDRFAVLPLCYSIEGSEVAFSDRADGVPPLRERAIDLQALFNYAYVHVVPAPRTAFVGVHRVPPAGCLTVRDGDTVFASTWRPRFASAGHAHPRPSADEFRELLRAAVQREVGGGRVGAFLSGGTDSSTVAGMLKAALGIDPDVFSIGFDAAGYDEIEYATIAARHFGCRHHVYYVTPDDVAAAVPAIAGHYDQPFGNSSALAAYYCATRAREHGIRRLLAGDGGDELYGGNVRYAKQKVFAAYDAVPSALRTAVVEPLVLNDAARRLPLVRKLASYVTQARVPMPDRTDTYNLLVRHGIGNLFAPEFVAAIRAEEPAELQRRVYAASDGAALVDRMLAYDWRFTLSDNDLPKVIGTSTLAAMEVAFPLLDDRIVDFSLRLTASQKVNGTTLRPWFKEALTGFLPIEVVRKKKHGFGLPFGPWLVRHAGLQRFARDAVEGLIERRLVLPSAMDRMFSPDLERFPGYYGELIWILMMLEHWLRSAAPRWRLA